MEPLPDETRARSPRRWLLPIGVGLIYGLVARLWFGFGQDGGGWFGAVFSVMTIAYLFAVPLVVGTLTVELSGDEDVSWTAALVGPWGPMSLVIVGSLLLAWEGLICAVVWLPIAFVCASIGGAFAKLWEGRRRGRPPVLTWVALLPVVFAPVESQLPDPDRVRTVTDRIEIAASPEAVWREIREVPPIRPDELSGSLAYRIGFPRPIEARLDGEGVGAVRYATFEGGVTFVERVTEWEEGRSLAFTIDASAVPSTTFDQHVAVGGRYFDVLTGRYVIEAVGPNRVVLHLTSEQRLSTRFNGYMQLWTDRFMSDIQETILEVIRDRAERAG